MFSDFALVGDLASYRDDRAPSVRVLETDQEFETMPTDWLYELALITEDIAGTDVEESWIPADAPNALTQLTGTDPVIGAPGDGGVTWTRQTTPPLVFLKPRSAGIPDSFRAYLIAEAIADIYLEHPEHPLAFFAGTYPDLQAALGGDPGLAYRLGDALTEAWCGLGRRSEIATWEGVYPTLYAAWGDAGDRLTGRIESLPSELANGSIGFAAATELACSAIKHDIDLPHPFDALDVAAFREHGPSFALRWTERTVEQLDSSLD